MKKKKSELKVSVRCDNKGCHPYKYKTNVKKRGTKKKKSAWRG